MKKLLTMLAAVCCLAIATPSFAAVPQAANADQTTPAKAKTTKKEHTAKTKKATTKKSTSKKSTSAKKTAHKSKSKKTSTSPAKPSN